jgi:hypothetical protein
LGFTWWKHQANAINPRGFVPGPNPQDDSNFKALGQNKQVLKWSSAETSVWLALENWSAFTDTVILFALSGSVPGPVAWRSSFNQTWQPFGATTLARIIWNYSHDAGSPNLWYEIQNVDHEIMRISVVDHNIFRNCRIEFSKRVLGQSKRRQSGVWENSNQKEPNRLLLRIPHR